MLTDKKHRIFRFETSNEELRSSNQELLSMNEELQSSNEELETAKEELQSVNEELETVNGELKYKVDELTRLMEGAQQRAQQQATVAQLGLRALEQGDATTVIKEALPLIVRALGVDACEVSEVTSTRGLVRRVAQFGLGKRAARRAFDLKDAGAYFNACLTSKDVVVVSDTNVMNLPIHARGNGVESALFMPVPGPFTGYFGVLSLYVRQSREFHDQDLVFLSAVVHVFTSALARVASEAMRRRQFEQDALHRSEEQLRRAEKLASLGTFAAGLAHEINNPLGGIVMSAQYARTTSEPDRLAELLSMIDDNAQRCARIVQNVLSFAKEENTARWPVQLRPIIERATDVVKSYGLPTILEVKLKLPEKLPQILANPTALEQVFSNLMLNAGQAARGSCMMEIVATVAGDRLQVTLQDDGPGMPEQDLQRIFDPFFSTRRKTGGTGLGLSIVHRIVADHGGTIRAASEPGRGATFTIELPVSSTRF